MTDQEQVILLENFKEGCEAAFERVFKIYYKSLHMQAFLLLKDEEEAEDLVQQLFLDLWNKKMYRNVQLSIKAYLHASLRNRCFNHLNKTNIKNRLQSEYAGHEHRDQTCENGFELEQEQLANSSVLTVLDELPVQRYKAFSLVHLQDKKYQEAASEMGISVNSLKTHIKLAVRFLRMRLG
jgi:RNA polymerase sigma-70 factor (ECF subfamily)